MDRTREYEPDPFLRGYERTNFKLFLRLPSTAFPEGHLEADFLQSAHRIITAACNGPVHTSTNFKFHVFRSVLVSVSLCQKSYEVPVPSTSGPISNEKNILRKIQDLFQRPLKCDNFWVSDTGYILQFFPLEGQKGSYASSIGPFKCPSVTSISGR